MTSFSKKMNPKSICNDLLQFNDQVSLNEPLAKYTTFKIGGPADFFCIANNIDQLINTIKYCSKQNLPFFILGYGSNVLVSDLGFRGVVIKNKCSSFTIHENNHVLVDSGYFMPKFANDIAKFNLSGCEFLNTIPGTLGGGVVQNVRFRRPENFSKYDGLAETRNSDFYLSDIIKEIHFVKRDGTALLFQKEQCHFSYYGLRLSPPYDINDLIITQVLLKLNLDESSEIKKRLKQYSSWKVNRKFSDKGSLVQQPHDEVTQSKAKQPKGATAGCIFFNIHNKFNHPTGRLIDMCGLKGLKVGDAVISRDHANYIVNTNNAKASDVKRLIEIIKDKVFVRFNIELVEEIKYIGEW